MLKEKITSVFVNPFSAMELINLSSGLKVWTCYPLVLTEMIKETIISMFGNPFSVTELGSLLSGIKVWTGYPLGIVPWSLSTSTNELVKTSKSALKKIWWYAT